jgi:hypothetical protein
MDVALNQDPNLECGTCCGILRSSIVVVVVVDGDYQSLAVHTYGVHQPEDVE